MFQPQHKGPLSDGFCVDILLPEYGNPLQVLFGHCPLNFVVNDSIFIRTGKAWTRFWLRLCKYLFWRWTWHTFCFSVSRLPLISCPCWGFLHIPNYQPGRYLDRARISEGYILKMFAAFVHKVDWSICQQTNVLEWTCFRDDVIPWTWPAVCPTYILRQRFYGASGGWFESLARRRLNLPFISATLH